MKYIGVGLSVLVVAGIMAVGCGAGGSEAPKTNPTALQFHPKKAKFFEGQRECPVCGQQPIKEQFHVDTDAGRVYFDKEKCVQQFTQNEEEYLQKVRQQARQQMAPSGGKAQ